MTENNNQEQPPTRPNQRAAAARQTRGGAAAARPRGARTTPQRGGATRGANRGGAAAAGANAGQIRPPEGVIKKFLPVYIIRNEQAIQECLLCRSALDQVCNFCRAQGITDTNLCIPITGRCGHIFHKHCIDNYLRANHTHCPYPGCHVRWENA